MCQLMDPRASGCHPARKLLLCYLKLLLSHANESPKLLASTPRLSPREFASADLLWAIEHRRAICIDLRVGDADPSDVTSDPAKVLD